MCVVICYLPFLLMATWRMAELHLLCPKTCILRGYILHLIETSSDHM